MKRYSRKDAVLLMKTVGEPHHLISEPSGSFSSTGKLENRIANLSDHVVKALNYRGDSFPKRARYRCASSLERHAERKKFLNDGVVQVSRDSLVFSHDAESIDLGASRAHLDGRRGCSSEYFRKSDINGLIRRFSV